jgi:hypothetical protein
MKFQDDQMPIPWVISILTPYVVMFNPLITQIKTKNWFVFFHVLSQQVFSIVIFCLVTFLQS